MTIRWCGNHGYEVHERMKRRLSERSLSLTWFAAGGPTPERRLVAGVGRRSGRRTRPCRAACYIARKLSRRHRLNH